MTAATTVMHEIGHSFHTGEADDMSYIQRPTGIYDSSDEVYSGSSGFNAHAPDPTSEYFNGEDRWSIMAAGWPDDLVSQPMGGKYYVYSIEELLTISEP